MLSGLINLFRPPHIDDPEKAAQARNVHLIILATLGLTILFLGYAVFFPPSGQLIIAVVVIIIELGLLVLVNQKRIQLAGMILTALLWTAIVLEVTLYGGIRDSGFGAFAAIVIVAGLTLGTRASLIFTAMTFLAAVILAFAETQNLLPAYTSVPVYLVLLSHVIVLVAVAFLINLAIQSISRLTRRAQSGEKIQQETNAQLTASQKDLQERSKALEDKNAILESLTAIARLPSIVKSEDEFFERSALLLMEKGKLDHISFFVFDQMSEFAILKESRSQVGKPQPIQGYKLTVIRSESTSLVMSAGTLRFSAGGLYYYVDQPRLLAGMHSSRVFPISTGSAVFGMMNIQTELEDSHSIDGQILQMLADQIALSLANIRLLNELQERMEELGSLAGKSVRGAWDQLGLGTNIGFSYDRLQVLQSDVTFPQNVLDCLRSGKITAFISSEKPPRARLAAPIKLRDAVIGVIGYDSDDIRHEWRDDEKAMLETVASRVSLALENTRLVAEAQQRAEQERLITQITSRMRETLDIETILKTAVSEIRQSMSLSEAEIRLQLSGEGKPIEAENG